MAKTSNIVKRDLAQIALEKTPLLRAALEELRKEFRIEEAGQNLIAHLLHEEKLDPTNLSHQATAIAFVSCRLNLALDRTTAGDRNKAVSVLTRVQQNPELLVKLYGVALTLEKSIQTLTLDPLIIALKRSPGSIDYYGLLDPQEETTLLNWNKNGLRDAYGLPPSSLKELDQIKAKIESAQAISFLGTKIKWQEILKEWSISAFASRFFCRPEKEKPAQAGIFVPFVTSLMIRTLLKDSWNRRLRSSGYQMEKTELFLFLDYELLKQFLELLLFDQESLFAEGKEAVTKIRSLLETDSLFFDRYTQEETDLFLKQLEPALKKFSLEARAFYMKIHSVEAPTPEEIDSFWRSKLFLYSRESAEIRLGKEFLSARPVWAEALEASTLETLLTHLVVFHQWAKEDKQRFVEKKPFDLLLSREPKQEAETRERVLRLWNLTKGHADHQDYWRIIREKIDWSKRADLVLDIGYCVSSIHFENEWFCLLRKVKHWEYRHLDNLPACAGRTDEVLEIILKNIASALSFEMWREIVKSYASNGSRPYVETVWRQMPQKYRARCFYEFSPLLFSFFLHRMNLEEVKNGVIPVLDALARQPQFEKNFLRWANQRKDNEQFPNIIHPSKGESLFLEHLKTLGIIL